MYWNLFDTFSLYYMGHDLCIVMLTLIMGLKCYLSDFSTIKLVPHIPYVLFGGKSLCAISLKKLASTFRFAS